MTDLRCTVIVKILLDKLPEVFDILLAAFFSE